jgi:hypothetical protein
MHKFRRWIVVPAVSSLVALIGIGVRGGQSNEPKRLTAADVITLWKPMLDGVDDFQQFVASPNDSSAVAAATFRVVGLTFERLWNHYGDLCGIKKRYDARQILMLGGKGAKGTWVVSDRSSSLASGAERALTVFLLRTDRYTVTATIEPEPDGKAVRGSIAAVIL